MGVGVATVAKGGEVVKAITLHQPWASLIALGAKEHETRSWPTSYRGLLAIHAGKTLLYDEYDSVFVRAMAEAGVADPKRLPLGAVVCVCELVAIYHTEDVFPYINRLDSLFGNFEPGRAAWKLKVVEVFDPPIPARGKQGLWDWQKP